MKTLKIMLSMLFLAAVPAQAYGPADDIAPPDMNIAFFPPEADYETEADYLVDRMQFPFR